MKSQTLGLAAATGVGTTAGLEAKDAITKKSSLTKQADVVEKDGKFYVHSKTGKRLGGPYDTKEEANKRLGQIHYFKNRGKKAMWIKSFNEEIIKYATLFEVFKDDLNKEADYGASAEAAESAGQTTPEVQSGVQETFDITDVVEDINPTCPHHGSIGVAVDVSPSDVTYVVRNESGKYKPGQVLTKTKDQLRVLAFGDNHDKKAELTKKADDTAMQSSDANRQAWAPKFSLDVLKSTAGMYGLRGNFGIGGSNKETGVFGGVGGSGGIKFDATPGDNKVGGELYGRSYVGYNPKNTKLPSPYLEGTLGVNAKSGVKPNWMTSLNLGLKKDFKLDQGGTLSPYLKANFPSDKKYRGIEAGVNYNF